MPTPNFIILYVDNPPASADFYAGLLGQPAAETSPTFALFALASGLMLGRATPLNPPQLPPVAARKSPSRSTAPVRSIWRMPNGASAG